MRGHFAVGFQSREEGEEGRGECVDTLQWATVKSREKGGGRRGERAVRGWRARARPRTGSATRHLRGERGEN